MSVDLKLTALLDIGSAAEEGEAFKAAEFDRSREHGRALREELREAGLIFGRAGRGYEGIRLFLTEAGKEELQKLSNCDHEADEPDVDASGCEVVRCLKCGRRIQ